MIFPVNDLCPGQASAEEIARLRAIVDAGLDPVMVASVLGHEDAAITLKVYAARFNAQRKDDAVRLALSREAI